jgi:hypothetical protein
MTFFIQREVQPMLTSSGFADPIGARKGVDGAQPKSCKVCINIRKNLVSFTHFIIIACKFYFRLHGLQQPKATQSQCFG